MKHKSGRIIITALPLLLFTIIYSCGGKEEAATTDVADSIARADSMALKVGVLPTLDCLPLYVAEKEGIFDSIGVDVRLKQYEGSLDSDNDLMQGTIDGGVTDCIRAAWMKKKGCDAKAVSLTNGYWQLITNGKARITKLSQMRDKMIAMTRFSATAMMASMAVDSSKIAEEYIFLIQINNPNTRLRMIQNNEMDAALLPEPQATTARQAKHPVLMDSREKDLQLGCIVFSEKAFADSTKKHQVELFLRAYDTAVEEINKHGIRAYRDIINSRMHRDDNAIDALKDTKFSLSAEPSDSIMDVAKAWIDEQRKK